MSEEFKITTHVYGRKQFTSAINGFPLIGKNGSYSTFTSRAGAKQAAQRRINELSAKERLSLQRPF